MRGLRPVALLLLAALIAGCGGGSGESGATADVALASTSVATDTLVPTSGPATTAIVTTTVAPPPAPAIVVRSNVVTEYDISHGRNGRTLYSDGKPISLSVRVQVIDQRSTSRQRMRPTPATRR
jgi:hypothetical protein